MNNFDNQLSYSARINFIMKVKFNELLKSAIKREQKSVINP